MVAFARCFSSCSACPLQGIGSADRNDSEHIEHSMVIEGADFDKSAINNIPDSRYGDTSLGNVGRKYNSPGLLVVLFLKNVVLVLMRESRVEHENL